jgi:Polyketide cyclase / dehydrase and lipid transport
VPRVLAEREVAARPERVFAFLADYREGRPRVLTDAFLDYQVEEGGHGAGRLVSYTLGDRLYRLSVERVGGHLLVERDAAASLVTTWRVMPAPNGRSIVRVVTEWRGQPGLRGVLDGLLAPRRLRQVYAEMLERLEGAVAS